MPIIYKPFWRQRTAQRTPRYIKGYPSRPKTLVRRFRGSTIRWDEVRILPRPRRHARVGWGTMTRLDKEAYLDSKMMPGIDGSREERIVYKALVSRGLIPGADFIFQAAEFGGRAELGGLVADFLFPLVMAILQVQSVWHTMTSNLEKRDADQKALLEDLGYTVLEIWPEDVHDPLRLDDWLDKNFGKMWGTSFSPSVAGSYTALEVPEILMNIAELEAQVQQLELLIGSLESDIEHITMAIFGGGASGPQLRITSASLAGTLSSANFETGVSGWQILRSGSIEINDLTARGTLQSYNYVAGTSGWKLDQAGTAEILQLTARGTVSSDNFVTTVSGWQILNTGSAEFNDILARGTVASTTFSTGVSGWQIHEGGSAEFNDITARGTMQSTTFSTGVSGWKIFAAGSAEFNDLTARGTVQSTTFSTGVSGWQIAAGGSAEFNDLTARGTMQSTSYSQGISGWKISAGGNAEFNDVVVRGMISASVFELHTVTGIGGTVIIAPAARITADVVYSDTVISVDDYPGVVGEFVEARTSYNKREIMKITALGAGSITVTRGQGGTIAQNWETGTALIRRANRIVLETTERDTDAISYVGPGNVFLAGDHANSGYKTAFSFTTGAADTSIKSVMLKVASSYGKEVGTARLSIYTDSAGSPGTLVGYIDLPRETGTGSGYWQTYDFGSLAPVSSSTTYWVVYEHTEPVSFAGSIWPQYLVSDRDLGNAASVTKTWNTVAWVSPTINLDVLYQIYPLQGTSRIDIYSWTGPAYDDETLQTRIGRLDGTTDPDMTPTGYGFYSQNAFFTGVGVFGSGAVKLDSSGMQIVQGETDVNRIKFTDSTFAQNISQIEAVEYSASSNQRATFVTSSQNVSSPPTTGPKTKVELRGTNASSTQDVSFAVLGPSSTYAYVPRFRWEIRDSGGTLHQVMYLKQNQIEFEEQTTSTTPATGYRALYAKADGWYEKDSAGVETQIGAGAGGSGPLLWLGW